MAHTPDTRSAGDPAPVLGQLGSLEVAHFITSGAEALTGRASGTTASDHFSMQASKTHQEYTASGHCSMQASTHHAKNTQRAILASNAVQGQHCPRDVAAHFRCILCMSAGVLLDAC